MMRMQQLRCGQRIVRLPQAELNDLLYEAAGLDRVLEDLAADAATPEQESDWDQANDGEPFDGLE